jgi:large subunit ribosomal protein L22
LSSAATSSAGVWRRRRTSWPRKVGPGRFPEKAARHILKVLEGAESNAEYKGLVTDDMYIAHSAASRGKAWEGRFPRARGRATPKIRETVNVEIILKEAGEMED